MVNKVSQGAEAKLGTTHCSVSQRIKLQVRIPLTFVRSHLPSLQLLTPGSSSEVPVQLVLLPPGAADLTKETPAVAVLELEQGVKVSLYHSDSGKKETKRYTVHGLSNALPKSEDWWCRGFRKLDDSRLQILFSSALDSDEKVAKDTLFTRTTQTRKSAQQVQASQAASTSTSTQHEQPRQPSQATGLTAAAASQKLKPPRQKKQQPQKSQQMQEMQAAEPTAAQLVSQIMQELDAEPAAQQPPAQLSGMKRPAEGQPSAEERSLAGSMHAPSQAGPGMPASGLVGVPIKPSDPRKRLLMHAGGLERRKSVDTSASSTAQPDQQRQQQAQQQQPPQQQPKEEPQQQAQAQREAGAHQQEQQQQADSHAGKSQPQQEGERTGPRPIPPPCPPPGGPPPPSKGGRGRPSQQHRAPPPPGMRPPPAGGWGPHDMPPPREVDPWEAQQYWEGGPGLEGGPGSRGPHMQQHWDGRGQPPPPPGFWDGPGPPPRHHDQFQKHGDRRPFPPDPKWVQGDRRKEPYGDPRGMDYQGGGSRDREFDRVMGGGRGGGFDHGRGGGRGGRGFDPREAEQRGFRDQFGPLPYPPEGHQESSYRHEKGRGIDRGSDRGSGDMRRPDKHPPGYDWGWGPEPDWANDRGWEDDPLRGPTGVIRRSGDRRMPPGRGMDSRGRLSGPPGSERRSLSPVRGPGLSRGPGFRGHPGEHHPPGPRPDRGPGREHSSERSRERSAPRSREGRSPERSMGSDRRGSEGTSPRRQRSPGSPHSDRRRGGSPQRLRGSSDGAPAAMVVPGAKQAYAAAVAAKRSSSVTPAGSSGTDTGANAGAARRGDRGDRGAQGKGAQEAADSTADQQPAPALCALIWQQQSGIRLQLKDLQACVPSLKPRKDAADLQLLFVEEQQGQTVVVAGPVTVQATLSADGRVGFLGEELKPVQEQLHGSVIVNMYPSEPNPDRPKGADSGGWPDALIVTVKQSGKAGANTQSSREPHVSQQQQLPAVSMPAVQQAWVQQDQPGIAPAQQQQQVMWQQQQQPVVGQQDQQQWVTASTGPPSSDGSYVYQQVQHVHVTPDGQYILQQPTTIMVPAQGMQAMNTAVQGLQTCSTYAGASQAGMLPASGTGMTQPAAAAAGYGVGMQPGQDMTGMQGAAAAAHLLPATASVTSVPGATGLEEQHIAAAAAVAAAGQAPVGQPTGVLEPHAGLNGQHAGGSPVTSTGGGAPPPTAAAQAGAVSSDEAAGAAPAPALTLPALPAVTGGTAAMTDEVMDAVVELVTLLNKDHDPSLDIGCCAEVLYDMQEDPAAAKKFMRVVYTALCSAVRLNNPAGAVSVIKRYLQKA